MSHDEYAQQLARQNGRKSCQHCHSLSGHYVNCALLKAVAAYATVQTLHDKLVSAEPTFTEQDRIYAHALGVAL